MSPPRAQTMTTQSRDECTNHEATMPPSRPENPCSRLCSCYIEFSFHMYRMWNIKLHQHNLHSQRPQSHQVHSTCQYTPGEMLGLQVRYWFKYFNIQDCLNDCLDPRYICRCTVTLLWLVYYTVKWLQIDSRGTVD